MMIPGSVEAELKNNGVRAIVSQRSRLELGGGWFGISVPMTDQLEPLQGLVDPIPDDVSAYIVGTLASVPVDLQQEIRQRYHRDAGQDIVCVHVHEKSRDHAEAKRTGKATPLFRNF